MDFSLIIAAAAFELNLSNHLCPRSPHLLTPSHIVCYSDDHIPLHEAVNTGHLQIVQSLVLAKSDVNSHNK